MQTEHKTYLAAQGHLKYVAVTAAREEAVLAGVKGDWHDAHIKQDRQEQLARWQLPELEEERERDYPLIGKRLGMKSDQIQTISSFMFQVN